MGLIAQAPTVPEALRAGRESSIEQKEWRSLDKPRLLPGSPGNGTSRADLATICHSRLGRAIPINSRTTKTVCTAILFTACLAGIPLALAGPPLAAGDLALRHDIQLLADYRIITGPVTTWPIDWRSIEADIANVGDRESLPLIAEISLKRVEARMRRRLGRRSPRFSASASGAENPMAIRGFQDTPREEGELAAGLSWSNKRFNIDLNVQGVDNPDDGKDVRPDGSEIGVNLGNWTLAASTMQRWWGPGWDGSLILSNNARPIPALTLRRSVTKAFESKWLRWIGPWDLRVIWGRMENNRAVPHPRFFGMKVTFKPHPSLEIGLLRTAIWCGSGRPCGFNTFFDIFTGNDNLGDNNINFQNEPSDQLAGVDFRWSNTWLGTPMAFYAQVIGEDEAGGLPSRPLAMAGLEFTGWSQETGWSYRWFAEAAGTSCDFVKSDIFNCAYNHGIYQTGYRFRGRAIGHGADNDAFIGSFGLVLVTERGNELRAIVRSGKLNRGGAPDPRNTLTPTSLDISSVDLGYAFSIGASRVEIGVGYEQLDDPANIRDDNDVRGYLQWRFNP